MPNYATIYEFEQDGALLWEGFEEVGFDEGSGEPIYNVVGPYDNPQQVMDNMIDPPTLDILNLEEIRWGNSQLRYFQNSPISIQAVPIEPEDVSFPSVGEDVLKYAFSSAFLGVHLVAKVAPNVDYTLIGKTDDGCCCTTETTHHTAIGDSVREWDFTDDLPKGFSRSCQKQLPLTVDGGLPYPPLLRWNDFNSGTLTEDTSAASETTWTTHVVRSSVPADQVCLDGRDCGDDPGEACTSGEYSDDVTLNMLGTPGTVTFNMPEDIFLGFYRKATGRDAGLYFCVDFATENGVYIAVYAPVSGADPVKVYGLEEAPEGAVMIDAPETAPTLFGVSLEVYGWKKVVDHSYSFFEANDCCETTGSSDLGTEKYTPSLEVTEITV